MLEPYTKTIISTHLTSNKVKSDSLTIANDLLQHGKQQISENLLLIGFNKIQTANFCNMRKLFKKNSYSLKTKIDKCALK